MNWSQVVIELIAVIIIADVAHLPIRRENTRLRAALAKASNHPANHRDSA